MRFMSVMLGLLCLPLLAVAILLSPIIVPALCLLAAFVPGFTAFRRTSSRCSWNLAAYHSPHSLTWRWLVSFTRPRSKDEGRWIGFFHHGRQTGFQFARYCLSIHTQEPMWYRDLYQRARDEEGGFGRGGNIDAIVKGEYMQSVSAGAAARQVCRCLSPSSPLKRMLEDMLADANRASHDRYRILQAFKDAAPEAGRAAAMDSFRRVNRLDDAPGQVWPASATPAAIQ